MMNITIGKIYDFTKVTSIVLEKDLSDFRREEGQFSLPTPRRTEDVPLHESHLDLTPSTPKYADEQWPKYSGKTCSTSIHNYIS